VKLPRDVAADRVITVLTDLGYQVVRQKGSHIRMRHPGPPAHSITVPHHQPLKVGTLHAIFAEVSRMRALSLWSLIDML
jgi:predicted RNA binding protein YcfA (HicA-like mRNA interferase family)